MSTDHDQPPHPKSPAKEDRASNDTSASLASQPAERIPFAARFWDRDAITGQVRKAYVVTLIRGTLVTAIAILAVLSIYWGAVWKIADGIHNLNGWVVDFDGGSMGQVVQTTVLAATGQKSEISWSVVPSSRFSNGPSDVAQATINEECWVAIVVNPGATARLDSAVAAANASYDASQAITIYAVEARNENSFPLFISPLSRNILDKAAKNFANIHAKQLASNGNITALISAVPDLITQPMYYTLDNLRPFDSFAASAADFVGLIYLLIIAFLVTNLNFAARMESGLSRHLSYGSLIRVRLFSAISMYFFLSLIYSLLSLAFKIPFNRRFGHAGFFIFWMLDWVGMCALGLALEAMVTLLTPRFTPYFMILWIIVNVSVCYYPIETLPAVYRYGFAVPFYNVSRAVRTIVFSTRNQVGLNFGVMFAWIAISFVTIPLFQWFRRRQEVREWRAKRLAGKSET